RPRGCTPGSARRPAAGPRPRPSSRRSAGSGRRPSPAARQRWRGPADRRFHGSAVAARAAALAARRTPRSHLPADSTRRGIIGRPQIRPTSGGNASPAVAGPEARGKRYAAPRSRAAALGDESIELLLPQSKHGREPHAEPERVLGQLLEALIDRAA